jgi:hypothetical protein
MFTPDGRLREDFVPPEASSSEESTPEGTDAAPPAAAPAETPGAETPRTPAPVLELPGTAVGAPSFFDLLAVLAEPVSIYLGDLELPDGQSAENLDLARLHIDLLDLLRQRTAGNLSAQEQGVLDDLLYRLRVRYVQKRG